MTREDVPGAQAATPAMTKKEDKSEQNRTGR